MSDRTFGLFVGMVLLVVGSWPLVVDRPARPVVIAVGLVLFSFGLLFPRILHWPKFVWLSITHQIGRVVNFVLTAVMFYGVVTPVALYFKLIGRDVLRRRLDKNAASYWVSRSGVDSKTSDMKHQF